MKPVVVVDDEKLERSRTNCAGRTCPLGRTDDKPCCVVDVLRRFAMHYTVFL